MQVLFFLLSIYTVYLLAVLLSTNLGTQQQQEREEGKQKSLSPLH